MISTPRRRPVRPFLFLIVATFVAGSCAARRPSTNVTTAADQPTGATDPSTTTSTVAPPATTTTSDASTTTTVQSTTVTTAKATTTTIAQSPARATTTTMPTTTTTARPVVSPVAVAGGLYVTSATGDVHYQVPLDRFTPLLDFCVPTNNGRILTLEGAPGGGTSSGTAVFSMNLDGSDRRRVYAGAGRGTFGCSPDGNRIAWTSANGPVTTVYVIDTATGHGGGVASFDLSMNGRPVWAPDSQRLAIPITQGRTGITIVEPASGGAGLARITHDPTTAVSWSADGRHLAYSRSDGQTGIVAADGTDNHLLGAATTALWSPDGRSVALATPATIIVNTDGTNRRNLGAAGPLNWSSDSTLLVTAAGQGVAVVRRDGSWTRQLAATTDPILAVHHAEWIPGTDQIVYRVRSG